MRKKKAETGEMRAEYELSGGLKNPFAAMFARGTNFVLIEPDLLAAFPTSKEVNNALRVLLKAGAQAVKNKPQRQAEAS